METPRRTPAGRDEVLAATLRGSLTGLLLKKRVSLQAAEEALTAAVAFLGLPDVEAASSDPRLRPLVDHVTRERDRDAPSYRPKRVGEALVYRVQRNKQRRTPFVVVPVNVLDVGGVDGEGEGIKQVKVVFENDRIIIQRVRSTGDTHE
jgi:hypothetical protein